MSETFQRTGTTHVLSVTDSATATPVLLENYENLLFQNTSSSVTIAVSLHAVSATAKTNCVMPTAGNPKSVLIIPPATSMVVRQSPNCYVAAIGSAAGPSSLYITCGRDLD